MKFDTLNTSNFKSLKKLREKAEKNKIPEFPELKPEIQEILKESYRWYYSGIKKHEEGGVM